ncbi:hypothetical protein LOTGIDRAFT_163356 [Lottia gigantea]|uniref:Aspartyl/asparaginy/proline hydroxylase domain-containing protein n=1 Tax=Lottia gigantea TaxID=225164 RepID=V4AE62_LOTGI|nr:hypothetical protein LOTGIDRAFT_163356 [Lottia gigantea]ESO91631.1 hypothetical protein LOTGIDRAFT_163356 [Lottia gigantea]
MMMMDILNDTLEFLLQSTLDISSNHIVITVVLSFITLILIWTSVKTVQSSVKDPQETDMTEEPVESDACPYPNCVRCHQRTEILNEALQRLKKFKEENEQKPTLLPEVEIQLSKKKYKYLNRLQKPIVFYLPSLRYKDLDEKIEKICKNFFMPLKDIVEEYENLKKHSNCSFKENTVDSGSWKIYHLIDQGRETNNAKLCSKTMKYVKKNHHGTKFMQGTKFTNVAFSCLSPGTVIPQHYGPTNFRIRCQLPLKTEIEGTQWIQCGLEKKFYYSSIPIYMDDSFLHSATNIGKDDRVVLLFDIWHPDLSKINREFLQQIFSCDE